MTGKAILALAALVLVLSSCSSDRDGEAGDPAEPNDPIGADTASIDTVAADSLATPDGAWVVTPTGAGHVRIGMHLSDLRPYLGPDVDPDAVSADCDYVEIAEAPDSLGFMVVEGRLARIDVWGGATATAEGAIVGDHETRIFTLYPDARREPHKYTDGSYLIAFGENAPDTLHQYVFETDGRRVTAYRAGIHPPVSYVEGCS